MTQPDFLIVGAMKCGTSTLQAQLAAQSGVFMTTPKEPNFFSDDAIYAKGMAWYESLFKDAAPGDLKGEASTHYTKLPTYPHCLERLYAVIEAPKLIYMIRNPVSRTVSHYIHEWTMGNMSDNVADAFRLHPELVDYSRFGMQIAPYVEVYGADNILLVSLEQMQVEPQPQLERVAAFLGMSSRPVWHEEQARVNVSADRIRRFPLYGFLVDNPIAEALRRTLVPQSARDWVKGRVQMRKRPELSDTIIAGLEQVFAEDFAVLAELFPEQRAVLTPSYPFATP